MLQRFRRDQVGQSLGAIDSPSLVPEKSSEENSCRDFETMDPSDASKTNRSTDGAGVGDAFC